MINVKDQIGIALNAIPSIAGKADDLYPTNWARLPVVQYVQEENKVYSKSEAEDNEYVRFAIYLWNRESTTQITLDIDSAISSLGLRRIQCSDQNDPSGLRHCVMRYEGIVDVVTQIVYLERQ